MASLPFCTSRVSKAPKVSMTVQSVDQFTVVDLLRMSYTMHLPLSEHAVTLNLVPIGLGFRKINERKGKADHLSPVSVVRGLNELMLSSCTLQYEAPILLARLLLNSSIKDLIGFHESVSSSP
jgi:hypothetical protein